MLWEESFVHAYNYNCAMEFSHIQLSVQPEDNNGNQETSPPIMTNTALTDKT